MAGHGGGEALHARLPEGAGLAHRDAGREGRRGRGLVLPEIDKAVLTSTIAYYQKLGCWTPHVEITRPAFEVALDVFHHSRFITKRHPYEAVVAAPPDAR